MKIIRILAAGAILMAGVPALMSCNGKGAQKGDSAQVDTAEIVAEEVPVAEKDSLAEIFDNPAKKSEVATDSTYAVTESGLKYLVLKEGDGEKPKATDAVTVHYEGRLLNGQVFDSSYARNEPATLPLNRVIAGWTEGLQLMKTGGIYVFYIPSSLAYGEAGAPPTIGPDADLIFRVELIGIEK